MFDEANYARAIESFRKRAASIQIEYDASLTGIGIIISKRSEDKNAWQIAHYVGLDLPFDLKKDSSFQNTCEYLAIVSSLFILAKLDYKDFTYDLIGDSMSSLKWAKAEYTKSEIARNAAIGFSLLSIKTDSWLNEARHIAGETNVMCDKLSRNARFEHESLPKGCKIQNDIIQELIAFLHLCNPTKSLLSEHEIHIDLLKDLLAALN
jgi:hypothetical protein